VYCIEEAKNIIRLFSQPGSPIILAFFNAVSQHQGWRFGVAVTRWSRSTQLLSVVGKSQIKSQILSVKLKSFSPNLKSKVKKHK